MLAGDVAADASQVRKLHRLLDMLHAAARQSGLRCLPPPAATHDPDTGIEFEWFYKKAQRVLTFALAGDGADVWMYWALRGAGHEEHDPSFDRIVDAVCWVSGVTSELGPAR